MDWYIELEVTAAKALDDGTVDELVDALAPWYTGGVSVNPTDRNRWTTTITVDASDAPHAIAQLWDALDVVWRSVPAAKGPVMGLEVCDEATFDARQQLRQVPELVGASEVADLLEVSTQRVHQLLERPEAPEPVARLAAGSVWRKGDWSRFLLTWHRRPGRPGKYDPLFEHLCQAGEGPVEMSFEDIAELVGGLPPASSRQQWWENESEEGRHPQARAWRSAGRKARVDLAAGKVLFVPAAHPN